MQLVSYKAKLSKTVLLLSSQHKHLDVSDGPKQKPNIILYYNETKSGMDCVDERISTYSVKYHSKCWHVMVFCNLLDMACYNAFVLYTNIFLDYNIRKSHRWRCFLTQISERQFRVPTVKGTYLCLQPLAPPATPAKEELTKKGRCHLCPRALDQKSRDVCHTCHKNICFSLHSVTKCSDCK